MNFKSDFNHHMSKFCAVCSFLGATLVLIGYFLRPETFPTTAFGAMSAASIAASATFSASETFSQKIKYDNETKSQDHRRASYNAVIQEKLASFKNGMVDETVKNRASAALWASPATLAEMARFTDLVNSIKAAGRSTPIPENMRAQFQEQVATLAIAMRNDLNSSTEPSVKQIASMLFDDYGRGDDSSLM